jgi:hypothetical protein
MAEEYKRLYQVQVAASPSTSTYTATAGRQTIIKQIRIANTSSSSSATIKMWNGGSTDPYVILPPTTIDAGGFGEFEGTITLAASDTLVFQASSATTLTVTVYGVEIY